MHLPWPSAQRDKTIAFATEGLHPALGATFQLPNPGSISRRGRKKGPGLRRALFRLLKNRAERLNRRPWQERIRYCSGGSYRLFSYTGQRLRPPGRYPKSLPCFLSVP